MTLIFLIVTFLVSVLGAVLTARMRGGGSWLLAALPGVTAQFLWVGAALFSTQRLVVLSAAFDVVVALAWFLGFWLYGGEHISTTQWWGIALLLLGLLFINWR